MKTRHLILTVLITIGSLFIVSANNAQGQRPLNGPPGIVQEPEGGFSDNISGRWNCGKFGYLTLRKVRNGYSGSYTHKNGKVQGQVRNNHFKGSWWQSDRKKGQFDFALSIQRKTHRPTHMNGKWNYSNDRRWRSNWNCVRY